MSFQVGDHVGDYTIVGSVGSGGVGQVFKVEHNITRRVEAMKVLLAGRVESSAPAQRFEREIKLQAKLDHPNIASVHNAFWATDQLVMVMELVEGRSLDKIIDEGPVKTSVALRYAMQCLRALEYAHGQGITHRDIKPENIMVTPGGRVKLMDFGLAKERTDPRLTQVGAVVGSLYYISPEQARGSDEFDHRTDIYSFGCVLYEMVTGRRPFEYDSSFALLQAAVSETPPPVAEIVPEFPKSFEGVIAKAMAKDPDDRFQSARELRLALEAVVRDPSAAVAVPASQSSSAIRESLTPAQKSSRVRRMAFVASGLLAVVYLGLSALSKTTVADEVSNYSELDADIVALQPRVAGRTDYEALLTLALGQKAWSMAFSADGRRLAAATADSAVKVVDVIEGKVVASLRGHEDQAVDVEFSPDGRYLASAGWDGSAQLWDVRAYVNVRRLSHMEKVTAVAFSRDSRLLATGSADDSIRVWDLANLGESAVLPGPDDGPTALAFSPLASLLVAVSKEGGARLWAMQQGTEEALEGRESGSTAVSIGPSGLQLAAAGSNLVTIWDIPSRSVAREISAPGWIYALEQTEEGVWLALAVPGSEPNTAKVWNLATEEVIVELPHSSPVQSVAIGAGGRLFATVSEGGTLTVWKAASGS